MIPLSLHLLNRAGFIILFAYILVQLESYKLNRLRNPWSQKLILVAVFTLFTLISNLTGVVVDQDFNLDIASATQLHLPARSVLANTRSIPISTAGLIGGPLVGGLVGILSGLFRWYQGGYAAYTYFISSVLIGLNAGFYPLLRRRPVFQLKTSEILMQSLIAEGIQMACIYIFSPSKSLAVQYLEVVMLPMILVNALGTYIFISILKNHVLVGQGSRMLQAQHVLNLSKETLPLFHQGLNARSAQAISQQIRETFDLPLALISDTRSILSTTAPHAGTPNAAALIASLKRQDSVQASLGELGLTAEAGGKNYRCTAVPLKAGEEVIGSLILAYRNDRTITDLDTEVARSLADLLSLHIELALSEEKSRLLKDAEIKALQSQVNPHFFFNALNSISSLSRKDPEAARHLLRQLSNYFRANLMGASKQLIPLSQEIAHVEAYLSIVQTRFPDRFDIVLDLCEECGYCMVPPFCLQMLVENAVNHAFNEQEPPYKIHIRAKYQKDDLILLVEDNGSGIAPDILIAMENGAHESEEGSGTALKNIRERVRNLYGPEGHFEIDTSPGGTRIQITLPALREEDLKP